MSDIKSGDSCVFDTWAKTDCHDCACEFQVTRTVSKTIFGPALCDECQFHAQFNKERDKLTQQVAELRSALEAIKQHQEVMAGGDEMILSKLTAYAIANKALADTDKE